eukprot:TRINITY_DN22275_c0_g1_i1.p1 TRINITY_DN22275_c0_g1~~TRINITY_DN22275_c0_g1_i1.p1  ORF type:complete len:308 (-),score=46.94 TRINITY_DN22275_c0_g1_i1:66-989(-)
MRSDEDKTGSMAFSNGMSPALAQYYYCDPQYPVTTYNQTECRVFHVAFLVLYSLLLIWGIIDLILFFRSKKRMNFSHGRVICCIISVTIFVIRFGMFLPEDRGNYNPYLISFLTSAPIFFMMLAYILLIFWWNQLVATSGGLNTSLLPAIRWGLIISGITLLVIFIAVSIFEVLIPNVANYLRGIYGGITLVIGLAFLVCGARLLKMMRKGPDPIKKPLIDTDPNRDFKQRQINLIFLWTSICSVTFIIVSIFQITSRFYRSDTLNGFVLRHSAYNLCDCMAIFFILLAHNSDVLHVFNKRSSFTFQ